jgi:hypothetical protein
MNEQVQPVGFVSIYGPGGSSVYIRENSTPSVEYSYDQTTWYGISWPAYIENTNTSLGYFKVEFLTDITVKSINENFICNSDKIQFGSTSLKNDGSIPTIVVDNVTSYPGFIQNGYSFANGFNNIRIFNLHVHSINGSTLVVIGEEAGGWIARSYFGKNASGNYIINCSSDGDIIQYGGGIVGSQAGSESSGSLTIIGCSSSGSIGNACGGIVGYQAGLNGGNVTCQSCWSTGNHSSTDAGGIVGKSAGVLGGSVTITNCYSTGSISPLGGGICGSTCTISISACYSTGSIASQAGGISGLSTSSSTTITNCYTIGNVSSSDGGCITGAGGASPSISNCYTVGTVTGSLGYIQGSLATVPATNFSEAKTGTPGTWNSSNANTVLLVFFEPIWIEVLSNQPYELFNMGYTPFSLTNINISGTPSLVRTFNGSITKGNSTNIGIVSNIYSKGNTTDDGYTVGGTVTKDMENENYTEEFDPFDYQETFFPGMTNFIESNIVTGDKDPSDKLIASYWNDLGDDVFDDWGYFYIYDVTTGKYYFPLINPQNLADGLFTTQNFIAFGRTFSITSGWAVQGIFKFEITVNDNLPFVFGAYGNMGSDGDEFIEDLTYPYTIGSTNLTLYYHHHAEDGDDDEQLWSYFIPKNISENNSKTYNAYYDSDDMSMMSKAVTSGLIVYFAKTNDVKEWVVNDLNIPTYQILAKTGGNISSYSTITMNSANGSISTTSLTVPDIYTLYIRNTGSYNITSYTLTVTSPGPVPCLTEDTWVLTPSGYTLVKHLRKGDSVVTSDRRIVPIRDIYHTIATANKDTNPYIIPKDSLAKHCPKIDTKISGDHLILFGDEWIHPRLSKRFKQDHSKQILHYYHIQLFDYKTQHLVINGGLIVESFAGFNHPFNSIINKQRNRSISKLPIKSISS